MAITPTFTIAFDIDTKQVTVTSTTDYASPGVALTDVTGGVQATAPDGTIFKVLNTAEIDMDVDRSLTFNLPLDSNGDIQEGNYRFQTTEVVVGAVEPGTYTSEVSSFTFCNECPTAAFSWTVDCNCSPVVKLTDITDYTSWTTTMRTLTLVPPANAPYNTPQTSAGLTVDIGSNPAYEGIWGARLSAELTRDYGTHTASCTVTQAPGGVAVSSSSFDVECEALCEVRCCVDAAYTRWNNARTTGASNQQELYNQWITALLILLKTEHAVSCGDSSDVDSAIASIRSILSCTDDCGDCKDSKNGLITPLCEGAGVSYTFVGDAGYLNVNVAGSTVTYTFDSNIKALLSNVTNATVTADPSLSGIITITPTVIPGSPNTTNYLVSWVGGALPTQTEMYSTDLELTFSGGAVLAKTNSTLDGSVFQAFTETAVGGSGGSWPSNIATIRIENIHSAALGSFKVMVTLTDVDTITKTDPHSTVTETIPFSLVKGSDSVEMTFKDQGGGSLTWGYLSANYAKITISVLVKE